MTKRQLSRHQREQQLRRTLFAIVGVVAVIIIAVIGYGFWREFVQRGNEPIAKVGETEIATRTLANVMGYYHNLYGMQATELEKIITEAQTEGEIDEAKQNLVNAAFYRLQIVQQYSQQLDQRVLELLVEGELLRHEAGKRGIAITDAERDQALVEHYDLGLDWLARALAANDAGEPVEEDRQPVATPESIAAAKEKVNKVTENGRILSEADLYRLIIETDILFAKVREALVAEVPTSGEQVRARHILAETEQLAQEALAMIEKGELDFAEAAKQLSTDTTTKEDGGDLGWFPRNFMDPAFEEAAFALEPGQVSGVVPSQFGFHIIKVEEKAADREYDPLVLGALHNAAYQQWATAQKLGQGEDGFVVEYLIDLDKLNWAQNNTPRGSLSRASG
jgi:parvulin-like peptidyl-prolyl isomerase